MSSIANELMKLIEELNDLVKKNPDIHCISTEELDMAKLKQQDRRETHDFEIGDLVTRHGAVGQGIILAIDESPPQSTGPAPYAVLKGSQIAYCVFRPHEFELRKEARRLLSTYNLGEEMKPWLAEVPCSQLSYVDKAPKSWFTPPSTRTVSKDRFADILEEEE